MTKKTLNVVPLSHPCHTMTASYSLLYMNQVPGYMQLYGGGGGGGYGVYLHFQQYFRYIVAVSFIGRGNKSTQRKPLTCHKSLTNFIT